MNHPTARLVCLLVLAAVIPFQGAWVLFALTMALLAERGCRGRGHVHAALGSVWRMRWLLLAIAVLYAGFTPGPAVFDGWSQPTWPGLAEGTRRTLILVVILLAVHSLIRSIAAHQLAAALVQLLHPLARLGVPTRRLAVRLATALDAVATVEHMARDAKAQDDAASPLDRAAQLIARVESAAARQTADSAAALPALGRPPLSSWLAASAILMAGLVLAML